MVVLNYNVPMGEGPASVIIGESPELTDPIVTANDDSWTETRQFVTAGLQENRDYFYRIHSGRFSTTACFRTASVSVVEGETNQGADGGDEVYSRCGSSPALLGRPEVAPVSVKRGVDYLRAGKSVNAGVIR
jgi:hypothetical protein